MFDVETGARLAVWNLPPALNDTLGFRDKDRLVLCRTETLDGKQPPYSEFPASTHPRVARLRQLIQPDSVKLLAEFPDFNRKVFGVFAPMDGRFFLVQGIHDDGTNRTTLFKVFDGDSGKELWQRACVSSNEPRIHLADSSGKLIAFREDISPVTVVVDTTLWRTDKTFPFFPFAIRSEPRLYAANTVLSLESRGIGLYDGLGPAPLITLGIDAPVSFVVEFDPTGQRLAWGNTDGTVTVCNVEEIRERLRPVGLAW